MRYKFLNVKKKVQATSSATDLRACAGPLRKKRTAGLWGVGETRLGKNIVKHS